MSTLLMSSGDVARCLQAPLLLESLREAITLGAEGDALDARFPVRTGRLQTPDGQQLLGVRALKPAGEWAALLEATRLLSLQRALVGALAAKVLAKSDAPRLAMIGAGNEATVQMKSLRLVRSLSQLRIYDADPGQAAVTAQRLFEQLSIPTRTAQSAEEAVLDADLVLIEKPAPESFLRPGMLRPGAFVQCLAGGASPFHAALLGQARVVRDELPRERNPNDAVESLGDILRTPDGPPRAPEAPVLFLMGNGEWLDRVGAWDVLEVAREDESLARFDFRRTEPLS